MVRKLLKALTFAASGLFLALHCTAPNGGTGSQAPNSNISGVIYNANGSPAANATVHFYPVSYNPYTKSLGKTKTLAAAAAVSTLDSTRTDATGHYNVNLDSGSYNLLASGDGATRSALHRDGEGQHDPPHRHPPGSGVNLRHHPNGRREGKPLDRLHHLHGHRLGVVPGRYVRELCNGQYGTGQVPFLIPDDYAKLQCVGYNFDGNGREN